MLLAASFDGLGIAGLVVAVVAVIVAVLGILAAAHEGRKQIRAMEKVRDELSQAVVDLKGEVETHYVGKFPEFLREIIKILESATESITIFCDLPAYGRLSDPERFRQYMEVIEKKAHPPRRLRRPGQAGGGIRPNANEIEVRLLHLGPKGRRASLAIQFGDLWETLRDNPKVAQFVTSHGASLDSLDQDGFFRLIEGEQAEALSRLRSAGVATAETDLIMPLYFWIVDSRKAVFALTEFDPDAHEVGFQTGSMLLIKALNRIYDRYHASRTEAERAGEAPAAVVPERFASADGGRETSE